VRGADIVSGGALALSMALVAAACGSSPNAPAPASPSETLAYDSVNFHFEYPAVESATIVVSDWGREGLGRLISTNGDTSTALRMPQADFERAWYGFVRQRYGL
jgi:hypothetical protein